MQVRTLALAGGAVVVVGAALAGGYYFGQNRQSQPQAVSQGQPASPPNTYAAQQPPPQSPPSESSSAMPQGYESAQFSAEPRFGAPRHRHGARHPVDFAYFHNELSRYGRWERSDRWGQVWQPSYVDAEFRPYDRGHWANTQEFGWTWVSDYEWGSIPFHYGRWVDDPERGWLWIPGYVWGPGWVVWRSNDRYTGWMPMPPDREFLRGDETYRNDWHQQADYGYRDWYGPQYDENRNASMWVFVDTGHVADHDYHRYEVSQPDEVRRVISQTTDSTRYTTVNNYVVNQSIDVKTVEQASGHKVEAVPATTVVKKPELVTQVSEGKQTQIEARQEAPTGSGKPNSAPPSTQPAAGAAPTTGTGTEKAGAAPKEASAPGSKPQTNGASVPSPSPAPTGNASNAGEKPFLKPEGSSKTAVTGEAPNAFGTSSARHEQNAGVGLPGAPAQSASERKHRGPLEREQGLSQATPKEGGQAVQEKNGSSAASEAGPAAAAPQAVGEEKRHRLLEREQGLSQATPKEGAQGTQEKNGPSATNEAGPAAAPPQTAGEERRHRLLEREQGLSQATPKQEPQGGSTPAANGATAAPNAIGSNEDSGPFRRHRGAPPAASQGPNQGAPENAAAQAPSSGGFPRGAESAGAASTENGGTANEPPRKRKLVLPASAEPSSTKPSQTQPGTDVRSESPPPDTGSSEGQAKGHKGRHKNDEPGADNGPPSP